MTERNGLENWYNDESDAEWADAKMPDHNNYVNESAFYGI